MGKKKQTNDTSLLDLAINDLLTGGLRNFSIDHFSSRHHISKKTIYQIFPSKEAFVNAALLYFYENIFQQIISLPENSTEPIKQLLFILHTIMNKMAKISNQFAYEIKLYYPKVWQRIERFKKEIIAKMVDYLKKAQQLGEVRNDLNLEFIALFIMQIAENTFQPEFFIHSPFSMSEMVKYFYDLIFNGILVVPRKFDLMGPGEIDEISQAS